MKMNVKLLRRIARLIVRRYKQVDMRYWLETSPVADHCGTAACIAGWAFTLTQPKAEGMPLKAGKLVEPLFGEAHDVGLGTRARTRVRLEAAEVLGLSDGQSARLFYTANWPKPYLSKHEYSHPGTLRYAKVVAARIEHFIATNGEE